MEFDRIRLMEHLAVDCPLSLQEFCDAMQRRFGLPAFEFDSENETEWGLVEHEGIEYNVSRPYERGTLEEWDGSGTFGVTLMLSQDCRLSLADVVGRRVYHHRT